MAVRQFERVEGLNIDDELGEDETRVHTHYIGDTVSVVTLMKSSREDNDYSGEPYECPYCDYKAGYPHVCDECGVGFQSGNSLGGHMATHNNDDEEEE